MFSHLWRLGVDELFFSQNNSHCEVRAFKGQNSVFFLGIVITLITLRGWKGVSSCLAECSGVVSDCANLDSSRPHALQSGPGVGLSQWAGWVISFQNLKQSSFPPRKAPIRAPLTSGENTNPCACGRRENRPTNTGNQQLRSISTLLLKAVVLTWQSCSVWSMQMQRRKHVRWYSHTICRPSGFDLSHFSDIWAQIADIPWQKTVLWFLKRQVLVGVYMRVGYPLISVLMFFFFSFFEQFKVPSATSAIITNGEYWWRGCHLEKQCLRLYSFVAWGVSQVGFFLFTVE